MRAAAGDDAMMVLDDQQLKTSVDADYKGFSERRRSQFLQRKVWQTIH